MAAAVEAEFDAALFEALAAKTFADTELMHELHGVVFKKAGADTLFYVWASVEFQDDGLNAEPPQQQREKKTGRAGADDGDLGAHGRNLLQ
jgi:hypothetical protein